MIKTPNYKQDFPIFKTNPNLVYLDSAATSLKPKCAIKAVSDYYTHYSANVHRGLYDIGEKATQAYENSRETVRQFINAKSEKEIIFTSGATAAINLVAKTWGSRHLKSGDEIMLTILEHHSNIVPWQMLAREKKCSLKYIDVGENGALKEEQVLNSLSKRTKLIAISHVSNAFGTIIPIKSIIQKAHCLSAKVLVDAAQSAPHMPLDVQHLDCDFLVFSGHKILGPTGIGVLYAKEKILAETNPLFGGGNMISEVLKEKSKWNDLPWKFEAGTPPIASAIGLGAAINYITGIGLNNIREHEKELLSLVIIKLQKIQNVTLYGPLDPETQGGILSFNIKGVHPHDAAAILNNNNIAIRGGHHCCMPLMKRLKISATCRASFYIYNSDEDIERLAAGIKKIKKIFA